MWGLRLTPKFSRLKVGLDYFNFLHEAQQLYSCIEINATKQPFHDVLKGKVKVCPISADDDWSQLRSSVSVGLTRLSISQSGSEISFGV